MLTALAQLGNAASAPRRVPFDLSFGVFLRAIASLVRSVLPVIVVAALYVAQKLFRVWLADKPEARVPLAETGVDDVFVLSCALTVALGELTLWSLIRLRAAAGSAALAAQATVAPAG